MSLEGGRERGREGERMGEGSEGRDIGERGREGGEDIGERGREGREGERGREDCYTYYNRYVQLNDKKPNTLEND